MRKVSCTKLTRQHTKIVSLLALGNNRDYIAAKCECSSSGLMTYIKNHNLPNPSRSRRISKHEKHRSRIKLLLVGNASLREIGECLGTTPQAAFQAIRTLGLTHLATKDQPWLSLTKHHSLTNVGLKRCHRCKIAKPVDEMCKDKRNKSTGRMGRCLACLNAENKALYHEESTGYRKRARQWQKDNPQKTRKYSNDWRKKNPEKVKASRQRRRRAKIDAAKPSSAE